MGVYKKRDIESHINDYFEVFPIVSITGPRQSGKSTLINHYITKKWNYYSLDDRELLLRIKDDPTLFTKTLNTNIAIDEAQKAPDLFHALKALADSGFPFKILLSGSANFLLMKSITESLAGRVGILHLLPFSLSEAYELPSNTLIQTFINAKSIDDLFQKLLQKKSSQIADNILLEYIFQGGYPKIHSLHTQKHKLLWFQNYISTYIEKDLRDLAQVGDIDIFQKVCRLLAFQSGNIINMSKIAAGVGLSVQTVKRYISILQTSFQCALLPAYFINQKKQIIKAPKLFYSDTGIINYFMQNDSIEKMTHTAQWGSVLETFVFTEISKEIQRLNPKPSLYYWRTNNGAEVDFVIECNNKLIPIEVKGSIQIKKQSLRGLKSFIATQNPGSVPFALVLYMGDEIIYLEKDTIAVPITMFY